jgi:hypothetical protein
MEKLRILLVEPSYKCKYPPLGLMKISRFHKNRSDDVVFIKGLDSSVKNQKWDRIYISTLFSFYWDITIKTIKYYEFSVNNPQNLFIGGPMATIMANEIEEETGYKTVRGLLNEKNKLSINGDYLIDNIVPDYSILAQISYKYTPENAYYGYATRGCIRKCPFCAVPLIEPVYQEYIPLKKQIDIINAEYGEKKDLLLLDNNVLASPCFEKIIQEIKDVGFVKGAKLNGKSRYVDFNQGVDLRKLTKQKMKILSEISIKPLRIAFDNIKLKDDYIKKVEWAAEYGLLNLSNYILYNYYDTPKDFYDRLKINVELNERLGTKIFSFPMKYIPVNNKDRKYVGKYWNHKYLRAIQCILHATHGIVGPKKDFFEAAFGKTFKDFEKLLLMPDYYIIYRELNKEKKTVEWKYLLDSLSKKQYKEYLDIILNNNLDYKSNDSIINELMKHYIKKK